MTDDGLFTIASRFPVAETMQRLVAAVTERNMLVFGRIDHSEGAARAGMSLRPTVLLIFGHPKGGTPLMQERQTAGIDLPLKALAWEDADGKAWLTFNRASWISAVARTGCGRRGGKSNGSGDQRRRAGGHELTAAG